MPIIMANDTIKVDIKSPSVFEDELRQRLGEIARSCDYIYKWNCVRHFAKIKSSIISDKSHMPTTVPKKYSALSLYFTPFNRADSGRLTTEIENLTSALDDRSRFTVSLNEFLQFVIDDVEKRGKFVSMADSGIDDTSTGREVIERIRDLQQKHQFYVLDNAEAADNVIEWANFYYATSTELYAPSVRRILDTPYVTNLNCGTASYIYKDYLIYNKPVTTLLEPSVVPIILKLKQGERLTEFIDDHGNTIKLMTLGRVVAENETLLVRGKILRVEKGGTYGFMSGEVIGKRIDG